MMIEHRMNRWRRHIAVQREESIQVSLERVSAWSIKEIPMPAKEWSPNESAYLVFYIYKNLTASQIHACFIERNLNRSFLAIAAKMRAIRNEVATEQMGDYLKELLQQHILIEPSPSDPLEPWELEIIKVKGTSDLFCDIVTNILKRLG